MHTKVKASCTVKRFYRSKKDGGDQKDVWLHYDHEGKRCSARVANMGISDMLCNGATYTGRINPRKPDRIRISASEALRHLNGMNWLIAAGKYIALYLFPLFLGAVLYWLITM